MIKIGLERLLVCWIKFSYYLIHLYKIIHHKILTLLARKEKALKINFLQIFIYFYYTFYSFPSLSRMYHCLLYILKCVQVFYLVQELSKRYSKLSLSEPIKEPKNICPKTHSYPGSQFTRL